MNFIKNFLVKLTSFGQSKDNNYCFQNNIKNKFSSDSIFYRTPRLS